MDLPGGGSGWGRMGQKEENIKQNSKLVLTFWRETVRGIENLFYKPAIIRCYSLLCDSHDCDIL